MKALFQQTVEFLKIGTKITARVKILAVNIYLWNYSAIL
jgi:hypothetical protein